MKKRWAVAAAAATIVTVGAGSTAGADPQADETYACDGVSTTFVAPGGWGSTPGQESATWRTTSSSAAMFDPHRAGVAGAEAFRDESGRAGARAG